MERRGLSWMEEVGCLSWGLTVCKVPVGGSVLLRGWCWALQPLWHGKSGSQGAESLLCVTLGESLNPCPSDSGERTSVCGSASAVCALALGL